MNINDMTLKTRVAGILLLGSLLVAVCGGVILYSVSASMNDSSIVDAAGRQRMLSQAMAKSIMGYSLAKNGVDALYNEVMDLDTLVSRIRHIYTEKVIEPARRSGVGLSMHPEAESYPAIPFPATFTRLVAEAFDGSGKASMSILAEDPVNPEQGLRDAVDREAHAALKANPDGFFSKAVEKDGKLYLRFYTADTATVEACASCHSKMKGRPFQVGDLLGIRRYQMLYADDAATGKDRLNPSLAEYETAKAIFTQTLSAFKSGGKYPANLAMTEFREYDGARDPRVLEAIDEVERVWQRFEQAVQSLLDEKVGAESYWKAFSQVMRDSNELRRVSNELTMRFNEYAGTNHVRILWSVVIMVGLILLVFAMLYLLLNRAVIRPITDLVGVASRIAEGDLTQQAIAGGRDEVGVLANALSTVSGNLNTMVSKINAVSRELSNSTDQIVDVSRQMESGLEKQAGQTQVVAESMTQMEETSRDMSRHADEAAGAAARASEVALEGGEIVHRSIDGMVQVSATVTDSAKKVEELARHSEQIDQIVTVIDDIANQTNLLALNAAIEAARAGEQGRGFAVVADEVRGLANRTTEATREIAEMVKVIQSGTEAAVTSMEAGKREAEHGVEMANQAGASLEQIVQMVGELSGRIEQIAAASRSQSDVTQRVTANVATVAEISEQTERDARRCAASSADLAKLAEELRATVEQFKI